LPNLLLFFAGLGGIAVGVYTLRDIRAQTRLLGQYVKATNDGVEATRKSAEAAEKSVKLQETNMRQWVDVEARGADASDPPMQPHTTRGKFEAVNNTSFPLTIYKIVTKVSIRANEWEIFTVNTNVTLPPNQSGKSGSYPFYIEVNLGDYLGENWFHGTILTINGDIHFEDCLGRKETQWFGGLYRFGPDNFSYLKPLGIEPDRTKENRNTN
jgi:hypothetical protein